MRLSLICHTNFAWPTAVGERYSARADGLQNALHTLGGAPQAHRIDNLSAAWVYAAEKQRLTASYAELGRHDSMRPTRNTPGVRHEHGAIEAPRGSLKHRMEHALKLRGLANLPTLRAYRGFIDHIVDKLNKRGKGRLAEEQQTW